MQRRHPECRSEESDFNCPFAKAPNNFLEAKLDTRYDPRMARSGRDSGFYHPKGALHFHIKYRERGIDNRSLAHELKGCKVSEIEWVWIIEERRQASPEEVRQLCAGNWDE